VLNECCAYHNSAVVVYQYWNGRGLMEVARLCLAVAGKFPGTDYTDGRYHSPEGELTCNLGRMPVIEKDGQCLGQSVAINFFVATDNGLMGDNAWEAAHILAVNEHLKEMTTVFRTLVPWGVEPTSENVDKWFDGGATDLTGPADRAGHSTRYLTWWLGRIEATLGNNGFAIGDKISLADVLLFAHFGDYLTPAEAGELPEYRRSMFTDKARTDAAISKHPKIKACVDAVANHPNVQKWLAMRGPQGF
jgi:glutathione S-transferase